jgi:hypothetical protein
MCSNGCSSKGHMVKFSSSSVEMSAIVKDSLLWSVSVGLVGLVVMME